MSSTEGSPSRELLQRAFNELRKPDWGSDLDAALTHPLRGKIIVMAARDILRRGHASAKEKPVNTAGKSVQTADLKPPPLDRKRLASGEREDD